MKFITILKASCFYATGLVNDVFDDQEQKLGIQRFKVNAGCKKSFVSTGTSQTCPKTVIMDSHKFLYVDECMKVWTNILLDAVLLFQNLLNVWPFLTDSLSILREENVPGYF
jgi:hypothetical protein